MSKEGKFRAKAPEVLEAMRFVPDGWRGRLYPYTASLAEVSAFAGPGNESLIIDLEPGEWVLRSSLGCWSLSDEKFLDWYVEVAVGEEKPPPAPLDEEQIKELTVATEDAFKDHPGFLEMWDRSTLQNRVRTRARLIVALMEASS